jgi:hypothetical protein
MDKFLEIGEIGLLRDIPVELTFLTKENRLLKQSTDKIKFQKKVLVFSLIALGIYIIWSEINKRKEKINP